MPTSRTRARRAVVMLTRLGLDPRPLARRIRDAILRPQRAEMAAMMKQVAVAHQAIQADAIALRHRTEMDAATLLSRIMVLDEALGSARLETAAVAAALDEARRVAAEREAEAARLQQGMLGRLEGAEFRLDGTQAALAAVEARFAAMFAAMDERSLDVAARLAEVEARIAVETAALRVALAADRDAWQQDRFLLEQLLTGTAAARPPGARRAVALLPDPAVAVILPTHDRAAFVAEAIASVQAQHFRNWELIVIDDGSTDDTAAAVAPFLGDARIRFLSEPRAGAAVARNRGLAETRAPLIAYIDSDNLWYPDFLARAVDALATDPDTDLVYGALVTDSHDLERRRILWSPFDRATLLRGNFIDTNVLVHRRDLVARHGGWDEAISRLMDWDLVLRYTADRPARAIDVLAARYRRCDDRRLTDVAPYEPNAIAIRRKWFPPATPARRPRVLYVVWHYPQLSESYVETEVLCMRAWGVHVEMWRTASGPSVYPTVVPIHEGTLDAAIAASRPDIIHVHWLGYAHGHGAALAACGLPITLRLHGFDTTRDSLLAALAYDWVKAVYAFPNQIAACGFADPRLKAVPVAFDTTLFKPRADKDRRLVVRTSAGLASKDLMTFLDAAKRLPAYRFVLAVALCHLREDYVDYLLALNAEKGLPVEIIVNAPRDVVADLVGRAAIYVHTARPPGAEAATPIGQPISIVEAMATGCYCLVRDVPDLAALAGDAGGTYSDLDGLLVAIEATAAWSDAEWTDVQHRAIGQAYRGHADVVNFQPVFNDWMALSASPATDEGHG